VLVAHGLFGLSALLVLAWCLSADRWKIPLRTVLGGVALQIGLAVLLIKFPPATAFFFKLNDGVAVLQKATDAGTTLVFGYLGGAALPFTEVKPGASFILAFRAFPLVLVISALASLMLYWGLLQRIVGGFAFVLRNTLGVGGALGLGAAVHIFVGMVEAPLLIRPYLQRMSRGELFALMSCGLAGIAGTVMVIYAALLGPVIPNALGHIRPVRWPWRPLWCPSSRIERPRPNSRSHTPRRVLSKRSRAARTTGYILSLPLSRC
jgi:CNT family concentrative nucleoside transporter